jgi:hypothetical protein
MSSNAVIDVGLGIVLMYLLLSLVCTMVNEFVSGVLGLRAKTLAKGLEALIDDEQLLRAFRAHGLIAGQASASGGDPSYLAGKSVAAALLDSLDPDKPVAAVADVVEAASKLPPSNVKDTVLLAAASAGNDIDKLRGAVAAWFDDSMDRLSGVYKRTLQWTSLTVGLVLAIAINADTLAVASGLWHDTGLRNEIVAAADKLPSATSTDMTANLGQVEDSLRPFPIGWTSATSAWHGSAIGIAAKLIGLLMTGLALSLGAPFWFDVLTRFVNIRSAGAKPDRADATATS